jgi:phospholipase/lecithinase/hemolysin
MVAMWHARAGIVQARSSAAGLREVKTACCGSGRFNGEVECSVDTNLCADRDEYLFWDMVHGTQAAYRRAVRAFFYGTTREAEPMNLHQLLQEHYSIATARYSSM